MYVTAQPDNSVFRATLSDMWIDRIAYRRPAKDVWLKDIASERPTMTEDHGLALVATR
jgi:hypothetical protein